ncbi:hypothetical protein MASR1M65_30370 [Saprospiraceae bacterium]
MGKKYTYLQWSAVIMFLLSGMMLTAAPDANAGKDLFKANCAACHNKNMKDDLTGPALGGVQERWAGREKLLHDWIRNSQAVIGSGDKYANDLYVKWNKSQMNAFPNLTDDDINSLLLYIDGVFTGAIGGKP